MAYPPKVLLFDRLAKGGDNPYPDNGEYDEKEEDILREELVLWGNYAEEGPTFDPKGKYLCGSCSMRSGKDDCTRVVSPISLTTGSCRIYTRGPADDAEPMPVKLTQVEAAYTERPHVKGFGCVRCMYGGEAKEEDSEGRKSWCTFWGIHVIATACCFKNTGDDDVFAPVKSKK